MNGAALLPRKLDEFVFDAQLLTLQIGDRILVRKRMLALLVDRAFERGVPLAQRLDAILRRHTRYLLWTMIETDANASRSEPLRRAWR
jgi:hypothetical protein